MEQYIKKSALVAEIERRKKVLYKDRDFNYIQIKELEALLSYLDTMEVKGVDLDEEADNHWGVLSSDVRNSIYYNDYYRIAKHFFELGLKTQNGE